MKRSAADEEYVPHMKLPRPIPGAVETVESLVTFIDNLFGARRFHERAMARLEPYLEDEETSDVAAG